MVIDPYYADLWNAGFEGLGSFFIARSIRKLYRDKLVRGLAWEQVAFWSLWGYANLFYYPAVGSYKSFWAGVLVTTANTIYLVMLLYYTRAERLRNEAMKSGKVLYIRG